MHLKTYINKIKIEIRNDDLIALFMVSFVIFVIFFLIKLEIIIHEERKLCVNVW